MVQELNLTESQIEKISENTFASKEKSLKLKSQLDSLHLQMEKAFSDDPKSSKKIISLAKKISDIRGQLFVHRIESHLAALQVLTEDQLSKLPTHRLRKLR
jgi:Spy/CpxP family protein refolding chaperone